MLDEVVMVHMMDGHFISHFELAHDPADVDQHRSDIEPALNA